MLDKLFGAILNPLLDRLPIGWKSALGLLAMLGLLIANLIGKLSPSEYDKWYDVATLVFGIGIYHAKVSQKPEAKPEPPQG